MFPIRWNEIFRKKDGTLGTMEDLGGGGSEFPEYDEGDAGKVLGVDDEGELKWTTINGTKVYYKDFSTTWRPNIQIAQFANDATSASGYYMSRPSSHVYINVTGYFPISAIAIDKYTGYSINAGIEYSGANPTISVVIANREINTEFCWVRVFYVKNENIEVLT